jgi:hypothetical protein
MDEAPEKLTFGDRYLILWRNVRLGCIGEVRNYAINKRGYRSVPLLLDDALMQRINMRFLATSWGNRGPEITVSDAFMALPLNFREAGIWHEIGHIHHEHHLNHEFQNQNQLRAARIAAIESGHVISHEAEADRFAIEHVRKEALIGFLIQLLRTRPTGGELGWNDAGRRELELRIATINLCE